MYSDVLKYIIVQSTLEIAWSVMYTYIYLQAWQKIMQEDWPKERQALLKSIKEKEERLKDFEKVSDWEL